MKTSNKALLIGLIIIVLLLAGAVIVIRADVPAMMRIGSIFSHSKVIDGNGNQASRATKLPKFHGLEVSVPGMLTIINGQPKIIVKSDSNILPAIKVYVVRKVLHVTTQRDVSIRPTAGNSFDLYTKHSLKSIKLAGATNLTANNLHEKELAVKVAGSGNCLLGGKVGHLRVEIVGSGHVDAKNLRCKDVKVKIAGSGNVSVNASHYLRVEILGSGKVAYYGNPKTVSQRIMGSGTIINKGK